MSTPIDNDEIHTFQLLQQAEARRISVEQLVQLQIARADIEGKQAAILVVDDSDALREVVVMTLRTLGYNDITQAADGKAALELLYAREFDLLVLDIDMPVLNGYAVLETLKKDPVRQHIPVIVASGYEQLESVVRCIELGAEDFLPKPINSVLLGARIAASLDRKRLRDLERVRVMELQQEKQLLEIEREKSDRLLLNILPVAIADRLKLGERTIAERYASVTVLFADLVDFINLANRTDPEALVSLLNDLFSRFDRIADVHGLEKIKTIGDSYMAVAGVPEAHARPVRAACDAALEIREASDRISRDFGEEGWNIRIGIHVGPLMAGIIGKQKFSYDVWGATVNFASRMESSGEPGKINVSADIHRREKDHYLWEPRGHQPVKRLGMAEMFFLAGKK